VHYNWRCLVLIYSVANIFFGSGAKCFKGLLDNIFNIRTTYCIFFVYIAMNAAIQLSSRAKRQFSSWCHAIVMRIYSENVTLVISLNDNVYMPGNVPKTTMGWTYRFWGGVQRNVTLTFGGQSSKYPSMLRTLWIDLCGVGIIDGHLLSETKPTEERVSTGG